MADTTEIKTTNPIHYKNIADAIRSKLGLTITDVKYKPAEMAAAVLRIRTGIIPTKTETITKNGPFDATEYSTLLIQVPASEVVRGTKTITENNATVDVTQYKFAEIRVPNTRVSGNKIIEDNVIEEDVSNFATVTVNVLPEKICTAFMTIESNGTHEVAGCKQVLVRVNESLGDNGEVIVTTNHSRTDVGGIKWVYTDLTPADVVDPESISDAITENGTFDVTNYAKAKVEVSAASIVGDRTITIMNNTQGDQRINVTDYAYAKVQVQGGGTLIEEPLEIFANNDFIDVSDRAAVKVNVTADSLASGNLDITQNGTHSVVGLRTVTIGVRPESVVSGRLDVTANNQVLDVTDYKEIYVHIPSTFIPTEQVTLTRNGGPFDVANAGTAIVNVPLESMLTDGTLEIKENTVGEAVIDVSRCSAVKVQVPPEKAVNPTSTTTLMHNQEYDVTNYAKVKVNVPASEVDEGTISYYQNGDFTVVGKAMVHIEVPDQPSQIAIGVTIDDDGGINLTANGGGTIVIVG